MLAIVAGFFLVAYLLGPGAIYKVIFGLFTPSKRFQRSRTEEIVFSVFATLGPFLLVWVLLNHTPLGSWPNFTEVGSKPAAYDTVRKSLLWTDFKGDPTAAYLRVAKEQIRFVIVLWIFCALEAYAATLAVRKYGDLSDKNPITRAIARACEKFFLVHVSEWQWLFSTDFLPSSERHKSVFVDVLTSGSALYRGRVTDWFTTADGSLLGLFLTDADRYSRDKLTRDRENGVIKPTESYWTPIPGSLLYIPSTAILNYNVRHVDDSQNPTATS